MKVVRFGRDQKEGNYYYPFTNECPKSYRALVEGLHFKRALAVSGGGDIPLTVLLPQCERLSLIDITARQLAMTCWKLLLLKEQGPAAVITAIEKKDYSRLEDEERFPKLFRETTYNHYTVYNKPATLMSCLKSLRDNLKNSPNTFRMSDVLEGWRHLESVWQPEWIHRIDRMIYGDTFDYLRRVRVAYDLIYTSNAQPPFSARTPFPVPRFLVKGGYFLSSSCPVNFVRDLKEVKTKRDVGSCSWNQSLHVNMKGAS